jgi:hypothetical protein
VILQEKARHEFQPHGDQGIYMRMRAWHVHGKTLAGDIDVARLQREKNNMSGKKLTKIKERHRKNEWKNKKIEHIDTQTHTLPANTTQT